MAPDGCFCCDLWATNVGDADYRPDRFRMAGLGGSMIWWAAFIIVIVFGFPLLAGCLFVVFQIIAAICRAIFD